MTTTTVAAANRDHNRPHVIGCGGDGCIAQDAWPLHHVRHRGIFCRLCTSCVLKYHPGSFCANCFEFFDGYQPSDRRGLVVHCSSCPSISHTACLPDPEQASRYVCACCANPNSFSYFPIGASQSKKLRVSDGKELQPSDERQRTITQEYAKVLLVAARLASASMSKAALSVRIEAEKKVKEAALARKRAREILEKPLSNAGMERERRKESNGEKPPGPEVVELKKKPMVKPSSTVSAAMTTQRRMQIREREREKWMKFHDPIPLAQRSPVKGSFMGSLANPISSLPNHIGLEDKGKVRIFSASKSSFASEEEKVMPKVSTDPEMVSQTPPPKQDTSVATMNSGSILTGSPNTATMHS